MIVVMNYCCWFIIIRCHHQMMIRWPFFLCLNLKKIDLIIRWSPITFNDLLCYWIETTITKPKKKKKNQQIGWKQIQSTIWFDLIIVFLLHKQVCFHLQKKKLIVFFQFFTNRFFFHSNHSGIILNVDIIVNWHKNVIGHSHEYYIKSKNRRWWKKWWPQTQMFFILIFFSLDDYIIRWYLMVKYTKVHCRSYLENSFIHSFFHLFVCIWFFMVRMMMMMMMNIDIHKNKLWKKWLSEWLRFTNVKCMKILAYITNKQTDKQMIQFNSI